MLIHQRFASTRKGFNLPSSVYRLGQHSGFSSIDPQNPRKIKEYLDNHVVGQEKMKRALSVALYHHYLRARLSDNSKLNPVSGIQKSNMLLLGPTGSGKTLSVTKLAEYLKVPFSMSDATTFTQSGYVGDDVDSCIHKLLENARHDIHQAQRGIVFIDEIDKVARLRSSRRERDVGGEGVQHALLKLIEGKMVEVKYGNQNSLRVNTENILFIFSGAFVGLEEIITKRLGVEKNFGFLGTCQKEVNEPIEDPLSLLEPQDLVKFGLIPEFVGRLPVFTHSRELTVDEMVEAMVTPQNSIVDQYTRILKMSGITLRFQYEALKIIAADAVKKKTGARGLRRFIESLLADPMYEDIDTNVRYLIVHADHNGKVVISSFTEEESEKADKLTATDPKLIFVFNDIIPTNNFLSIPRKNALAKASDFIIAR